MTSKFNLYPYSIYLVSLGDLSHDDIMLLKCLKYPLMSQASQLSFEYGLGELFCLALQP